MKKHVKGFTLVELIIVMAIFSIILFGALSLVEPTRKMMLAAESQESGNAAVSNISQYIRGQIAPCENIEVCNYIPKNGSGDVDQAAIKTKVESFINSRYKGIVKGGSAVDSPTYGTGKFHVMMIDNSNEGKIYSMTFTGDFETGAATLNEFKTDAVNLAYYDSYELTFRLGNLTQESEFTTASADTFADLASNMRASNTVISILAKKKQTGFTAKPDYSYIEHCSLSLVNIANRDSNYPPGMYYGIGSVPELAADGTPTGGTVPGIVDVHSGTTGITYAVPVTYDHSGTTNNGYMFIYSFADEMDV